MVLKWGICCVGMICQDFASAFTEYKIPGNELTAVAASSKEKAKVFADRFNIKTFFGSYDELAQFSDVDIVYVGSVHPYHYRLAKLFVSHGKHVLVELPMSMALSDTKDLIDLARQKKVFLTEGVCFLNSPLIQRIKELIHEGVIGKPRHINAQFQINAEIFERLFDKDLGGGGLLEFGGFIIQFALSLFKGKQLIETTGKLEWKNDIDVYGTIILKFDDGATAFLNYNMMVNGDNSASIYGDSGSIIIPNHFWAPDEIIVNGKRDESFKLERKNESITYNFPFEWHMSHEIKNVSQCIGRGLLENDALPLDDSLKCAEIIEKLLKR